MRHPLAPFRTMGSRSPKNNIISAPLYFYRRTIIYETLIITARPVELAGLGNDFVPVRTTEVWLRWLLIAAYEVFSTPPPFYIFLNVINSFFYVRTREFSEIHSVFFVPDHLTFLTYFILFYFFFCPLPPAARPRPVRSARRRLYLRGTFKLRDTLLNAAVLRILCSSQLVFPSEIYRCAEVIISHSDYKYTLLSLLLLLLSCGRGGWVFRGRINFPIRLNMPVGCPCLGRCHRQQIATQVRRKWHWQTVRKISLQMWRGSANIRKLSHWTFKWGGAPQSRMCRFVRYMCLTKS